ncbi:DUF6519 domain-containing protein [Mycolicibacterium iranicum]|uniref:Right handed beta helix domain-containing protein n=1 Tax=Mycolicibacterium iranicum TaxID=912594 RepID=A0A178LS17_MYCIR|nr:DUF6519 domain-containing protein [Mycolicibacterium iranicum]OAN36788.1 hypothetical protein A4X20_06225 [Mycolicibacterium iranicum]
MTLQGDFTREVSQHWAGVLYQQGRVFTDTDGTAQSLITLDWEDTSARDVLGASVAAVPASSPDSFRVDSAIINPDGVVVSLQPGHVWADGPLVRLDGAAPVQRLADYVEDPPTPAGSVGARDAVVLEVWREAVNGFQLPDELIEPALGGPDTTERIHTAFGLRLYRMDVDDTCASIVDALNDTGGRGRLTVTMDPETAVAGDCPVVEGGGYSGFEHNLYRIEIADTGAGAVHFKWSQFNGGLTGRAEFDTAALRAHIGANLAAITASGLDSFYLEALKPNPLLGRWVVVYGANVTLDAEGSFVLPPVGGEVVGSIPAPSPGDADPTVFVRLWNGLARVDAFPTGPGPLPLQDGINLAFDAPGPGADYRPGDYWTFPVRAGGVENLGPFPANAPPEGIVYRRVPLAELDWNGSHDVPRDGGTVEDCRRPVHPLTDVTSCCSFHVGDGVLSHGDFTSIQKAVDSLPAGGGKICVLPGNYVENVLIEERGNITISGCGDRSRVVSANPRDGQDAAAVFHVVDSIAIQISGLSITAHETGIGILAEDQVAEKRGQGRDLGPSGALHSIGLAELLVTAATRPAIEVRFAIGLTIRDCTIGMVDERSRWPAVFVQAEDGLIERNVIRVQPARLGRDDLRAATFSGAVVAAHGPMTASAGMGGLQIGGLSEAVRVVDNVIQSGLGNGITLGAVRAVRRDDRTHLPERLGWVINADDPCDPCRPGDGEIPDPPPGGGDGVVLVPGGPLRDILIERNRIFDMGLNGIGVIGFFSLRDPDLRRIVSVEGLRIHRNEIRRCLARDLAPVREEMFSAMGYGGISLAHVEHLSVTQNVIEDNGASYLDPVCGVFVLYGEGVEITHNRVVNNGRRTAEAPGRARPGRRGGIVVAYCTVPVDPAISDAALYRVVPESTPALRVHDNVVVAPLGRALWVAANGPVSVQANSFTSMGVAADPPNAARALVGLTVTIDNIGRSPEAPGAIKSFKGLYYGVLPSAFRSATSAETVAVGTGIREPGIITGGIAPGFVLFSDNQCHFTPGPSRRAPERPEVLDPAAVKFARMMISTVGSFGRPSPPPPPLRPGALLPLATSLRLASVSISSLDDVGVHDNQCFTRMPDGTLLTNLYVIGDSVRVSDNRFKEGPDDTIVSSISVGAVNVTAHNEGTHCFVVRPPAPSDRVVDGPNIVVASMVQRDYCDRFARILHDFAVLGG